MTDKMTIPEFFSKARPLTQKIVAVTRRHLREHPHEVTVFLCRTSFKFWEFSTSAKSRELFKDDWADLVCADHFFEVLGRYSEHVIFACARNLWQIVQRDMLAVRQRLAGILDDKGVKQTIACLTEGDAAVYGPLWRRGRRSFIDERTDINMLAVQASVVNQTWAEMIVYGIQHHRQDRAETCALWLMQTERYELCVQLLAHVPDYARRLSTIYLKHKQQQDKWWPNLAQLTSAVTHPLETALAPAQSAVDTYLQNQALLQQSDMCSPYHKHDEQLRKFKTSFKMFSGALAKLRDANRDDCILHAHQLRLRHKLLGATTAWFYERARTLIKCGLPQLAIKQILFYTVPGAEALHPAHFWDAIEFRTRQRILRKMESAEEESVETLDAQPAKRARTE